ncbi:MULTISPECIES: hypothetical protein [unclassified Providencia]|uniref:hypothetical protein n=1 Tax=unclassified Providencia TaxID=2633465 RepID=UPI0023496483|nr:MULTISPECIES: hypothetical protein [unclassified Providencia]
MKVQLVNGPCEGMRAQVKLNDEGMPPSTYIAELPAVCNDVHVDGIIEPFNIATDKFVYELQVTVRNDEPPDFEHRFPER